MLTCNTSVGGGYQKLYLDSFGQQGKVQMDTPTGSGLSASSGPTKLCVVFEHCHSAAHIQDNQIFIPHFKVLMFSFSCGK